jgi:protein transport protein SEC20
VFQDINTCPGPLEVLNELNREGRSKIGTLRRQINHLEILAKEEAKETERTKLLKEVESHRQQLARWVGPKLGMGIMVVREIPAVARNQTAIIPAYRQWL